MMKRLERKPKVMSKGESEEIGRGPYRLSFGVKVRWKGERGFSRFAERIEEDETEN